MKMPVKFLSSLGIADSLTYFDGFGNVILCRTVKFIVIFTDIDSANFDLFSIFFKLQYR